MKQKLCIYICNALVPELDQLLASGNYPDVIVKSFEAVCLGYTLTNEKIAEIVSDSDRFSKVIVVAGTCRGNKNLEQYTSNKVEVVQLEQCLEILFPIRTICHFTKQGYFLVSNGWLRNYKRHIREWGIDNQSAKEFFGGSLKKIMLLETGLSGDYQNNLQALSDYMGLHFEVMPVGTSQLQLFINTLVLNWRNDNERQKLNERISTFAGESANYTLVFSQLRHLINLTSETDIVQDIFKLINVLFAPLQIFYQRNDPSNQTTIYYKPEQSTALFDVNNSFEIEVRYAREQLGIFGIIGVKFPAHIPKYKSMADVISQMGGLAISNARKYTELEKTKQALSLSEEHFRGIFEQAPMGIALINSLTGQINDLNNRFAEIAGRTREEMCTLYWMQITHPDDIPEDTYNMSRLNAGEIDRYKMDKRYIKPNGEIVWASKTVEPVKVEYIEEPFHLCMIEDITERKLLEDHIFQSERLFKAIMLQSPSAIELYNLDGLQINVNRAYEELWGFPASRTVNKFNILESEEVKLTGLYEYVMRAYNGEAVQVPEYQFDSTGKTEAKGKGRTRWLSTRIYPLKDKNNKVWNIIITHEDVTSKRAAEEVLAVNAQKFKNLSESGIEMLKLETPHEIYKYITESFHQQYPESVILFLDVDESELFSSLRIVKGISDSLFQKAMKLIGYNILSKKFKHIPRHHTLFKSGKLQIFEGGLAGFSGSEFPPITAKAIGKMLGIRQIYTIGINKDEKLFATIHFFNRGSNPIADSEYIESFVQQAAIVIERKLLEDLLKTSEERYRMIAENTSDVIWSLNIDTLKFNYISPSIVNITGYTADETMSMLLPETLEEKSASFVMSELPKRLADYKNGIQIAKTETHELQQLCKNGAPVWIEITIMFKTDQQGQINELLGVTRNIDERKRAEIEIRKKNKKLQKVNQEKDKFFSIISHDLRSPFASIVSLLGLLAENSYNYSPDEINNFALSAHKTAQSTYNLLENLLEWSRMQRGIMPFNPETIVFHDFIKTCDFSTFELARNKEVEIIIDYPEDLSVKADSNMLHSIIRNLLTNAIKYTEKGGKVSVKAEATTEKSILFTIKDTGIGMPDHIIKNLFKVDKNTSRPGTNNEPSSGLGLLLCKEFVEKHDGKIWVESKESEGSTFFFSISIND